jgi:hypothetical protein
MDDFIQGDEYNYFFFFLGKTKLKKYIWKREREKKDAGKVAINYQRIEIPFNSSLAVLTFI